MTSDYLGLVSNGALSEQIQDETNGTSAIEFYNPSSVVASSLTNYAGLDGSGAITFTSVQNTNGTTVQEAFNFTPGVTNMTWNYNSANALTSAVENETNGYQGTYTYNASGWVSNIYVTGQGFTQNNVFSAPGDQSSSHYVNTANGATYDATYAWGNSSDLLQQSVNWTPGYATTTLDYATGANGDPVGSETLQLVNGETFDYGYATQYAGDPANKIIITTPGVNTVEDDFNNSLAGNPIQQQHVAEQNGSQIYTAYDTAGGNWTTAVQFDNASGVETELNTQYTNNTQVNQYLNGQAQGWVNQVFDFSNDVITENMILFTNGISYQNFYSGGCLNYYVITQANGTHTSTFENLNGSQPWQTYTDEYSSQNVLAGWIVGYNGYSVVNGNQVVQGNNADVPPDTVDSAGQTDSDPYSASVPDTTGSDGGSGIDTNDGPSQPSYVTVYPDPNNVEGGGNAQVLPGNGNSNSSSASHIANVVPNTLFSGSTATTLSGTGDTTYVIQSTGAQETIVNSETSGPQAMGEVQFANGATAEDLWFQAMGNNLLVDVLGTKEQVVMQNWFTSPAAQVQEFMSADNLKLDTQLSQLIQAMATYSAGHGGFNPQAPGTVMPGDTALQTEIAAAWHK